MRTLDKMQRLAKATKLQHEWSQHADQGACPARPPGWLLAAGPARFTEPFSAAQQLVHNNAYSHIHNMHCKCCRVLALTRAKHSHKTHGKRPWSPNKPRPQCQLPNTREPPLANRPAAAVSAAIRSHQAHGVPLHAPITIYATQLSARYLPGEYHGFPYRSVQSCSNAVATTISPPVRPLPPALHGWQLTRRAFCTQQTAADRQARVSQNAALPDGHATCAAALQPCRQK